MMDFLKGLLSNRVRLAGMDMTEINPRKAGRRHPTGEDQTYRVGAISSKSFCGEVDDI